MRLKLLAAASGLIGIGAAATGVARAGDICVKSDQERLSPIKMLRWSLAAAETWGKPPCDILTFERSGRKPRSLILPEIRTRTIDGVDLDLIYSFRLNNDGSGQVDLQVRRPLRKARYMWTGQVTNLLQLPPSTSRAKAFTIATTHIQPLVSKVSPTSSIWPFLGRQADGRPIYPAEMKGGNLGKCDQRFSMHEPFYVPGFIESESAGVVSIVGSKLCSSDARQAASLRIEVARDVVSDALGYHPPEPIFVTM